MPQHQDYFGMHGMQESRAIMNLPTTTATTSSDEEALAEVDEPPDHQHRSHPFASRIPVTNFSRTTLPPNRRKESLLTSALNSINFPTSDDHSTPIRGMSTTSTWSDRSTAELTSDGGFTSPTRTSSPSPPPPAGSFDAFGPVFTQKAFDRHVSIVRHDDDHVEPHQLQMPVTTAPVTDSTVPRKRCIRFACGGKDTPKVLPTIAPVQAPVQEQAPPKRVCTIKFACPSRVSTDESLNPPKSRARHMSPAPLRKLAAAPKTSSPKSHRDSDSTVMNDSPKSVRKSPFSSQRKLSVNSDLARSEAFRFHEFASSEDEEDEWTQEATCHRNRLTVLDTLKVENKLRKLGEEVEDEVLEDEEEEDLEDEEDEDDEDGDNEDEDPAYDSVSDDGFHSDDEKGYGSGEESDTGSDYRWWAPGQSTAATSMDHIEHIRHIVRRSASESSIDSMASQGSGQVPKPKQGPPRRRRSRAVAIRALSPELPDSTDFVCGTLDEDRPLEDAYMSCLERRRAAKHMACPQDIDPTFPQSDPEMEEEDENDELEPAEDESDVHLMMHGEMEAEAENHGRGRRNNTELKKRSPLHSPKRLRSPPPVKRCRSPPPPRRLFGHSPKQLRSPPAPARLRSPPPTRRGSVVTSPTRPSMTVRFAGLAERPPITECSSLPRTPVTANPPQPYEDDDDTTTNEFPTRGAIDIKIGLERKRLRRKEKLYEKLHRKATKEKEKRPAPGKGAKRMREMGMGLAAYKGRKNSFPARPQADGDVHMLSV